MKISGETHYLWRGTDHEGEVLESLLTKKRDEKPAGELVERALLRENILQIS